MKTANLAIKFGLELAALAAFAYWGTTIHGTALSLLAAIAVLLAVAGLWGTFAAPRAGRRLPKTARIPFELAVFALAAAALAATNAADLAVAFASVAALNTILLTAYRQWDA